MDSATVVVPLWVILAAIPLATTIAGALLVIAYRSGAIVAGLRQITEMMKIHSDRLDKHTDAITGHETRLAVLERTDKIRHLSSAEVSQ